MDGKRMLKHIKKGMKENPVTKKYLDKMIADGINEDLALDLMIYVWLNRMELNE